MKKALEPEVAALRLWRQLYQTYTLVKQTEDMVFGEHGLTTEQYAVLVSISYLGEPARITDIARWLERSTNSISMIVDRMVKAGLVRRARDKRDRRVVYVSKTSKAESLFAPATVASFRSVQKILSPMPHKDRLVLLDLLGDLKYETLKYLRPAVDIEAIKREELRQAANIDKWLSKYGRRSTPESKRQGSENGKTRKKTR
jgi:DNA-binding MarR family transcriptional regulator